MDLPPSIDRNSMNICGIDNKGKLFKTFKKAFKHASGYTKNKDGSHIEDDEMHCRSLNTQMPIDNVFMKESTH